LVAVSTMVYTSLRPSKALARLSEQGVEEVEVSYNNFEFFGRLGVGVDELFKEVLNVVPSLNVKLVALHLPYGDPLNRAANVSEAPKVIKMLSKWLKFSSDLGVGVAAIHTPFNRAGLLESSSTYVNRIREVNHRFFRELVKVVSDYGIVLAVENRFERGVYGYLPNDLLDLINSISDDHLKICLDTGHANINNLQPHEFYEALHPNIALIHAHDNDGTKDQHLPPYLGTINWDELLNTLKKHSFTKPIVLEVLCSNNIRRCDNIAKLLKIIARNLLSILF